MKRFNLIESNWNLSPIKYHDKIYEIEFITFLKLDFCVDLINQFEPIKDLGY